VGRLLGERQRRLAVGRLLGEHQRRLAVGRLLGVRQRSGPPLPGDQQRRLALGRLLGEQQRRLAVGRLLGEQQILGVTGTSTPVLRNILVCVRGICPREYQKEGLEAHPHSKRLPEGTGAYSHREKRRQ